MLPGEKIIELILQIVLQTMEGQTPEQRKQIWDWHIEDVKRWRKIFKMDE